MARKMRIPKAKQILGLKKAIRNRKTPRQFLPALRKRLAKLTAGVFLIFAVSGLAHAQQSVLIVPQQQNLTPSALTCTGSAQTLNVNNRNMTQHVIYVTPSASMTNLFAAVYGIDSSGNTIRISDQAQTANAGPVTLNASGYFPQIQVSITCLPTSATFTATYSGSEATTPVYDGAALYTHYSKAMFIGASSTANHTASFNPPILNSAGTISFQYVGGSFSGSSIQANCYDSDGNILKAYTFTVASATIDQVFPVPQTPCTSMTVEYVSGGGSGGVTIDMSYQFYSAGSLGNPAIGVYNHEASTSAISLGLAGGQLLGVSVNTPAAGTISLFDLTPAACTGTPSTNTVAVITVTSTAPVGTIPYNISFYNGICVKASSASIDYTVEYQ